MPYLNYFGSVHKEGRDNANATLGGQQVGNAGKKENAKQRSQS